MEIFRSPTLYYFFIISQKSISNSNDIQNPPQPVENKTQNIVGNSKVHIRDKNNLIQTIIYTQEQQQIEPQKEINSIRQCSFNLAIFLKSFIFDLILIILVVLYMVLLALFFILDTRENESNSIIQQVILFCVYIELFILCCFFIEICLKIYSYGVKGYFKDWWYIIDAVVIVLSVILLLVDLTLKLSNNAYYKVFSKVIRILFRFLRLFLVYRKLVESKMVEQTHARNKTKSPIVRIVEIFNNISENLEDQEIINNLLWCKGKIQSNQLYQVDNQEANKYIAGSIMNPQKTLQNSTQQQANSDYAYQKIDIPNILIKQFEISNTLDFDPFQLYELNYNNTLGFYLIYLLEQKNAFNQLQVNPQQLLNWAQQVTEGYEDNPYHNIIHAFDVTQTVHYFITKSSLNQRANFNALDYLILYTAAAVHDFQHPGFNNPFQINAKTELAVKYNDRSPLENHHSSSCFILMQEKNSNFLANVSKENYQTYRQRVIKMILSTDNSKHSEDLNLLQARLSSDDFDPSLTDKELVIKTIMHSADISNPIKPFHMFQKWGRLVLQEFFNQGDKERELGLPISMLCDRYTTNEAQSQINFVNFFVGPYFKQIKSIIDIPEIINIELNVNKWKEFLEESTKNLEKLKAQRDQKNIV